MSEEFKTQIKKNVYIISCPKRLDINNSEILKNLLVRSMEKQNFRILMDLKETNYVDSSGLGAVVSTISTLRANEGDIRLAAASESIMNLMEITHLNKILKCFKSVKEGIESFK